MEEKVTGGIYEQQFSVLDPAFVPCNYIQSRLCNLFILICMFMH